MDWHKVVARAKINLSLDVTEKRKDGYHNLRMIMQELEFHDTVYIKEASCGIEINCSNPDIPVDNGNTAYKAAEFIINKYKVKKGVKIFISKRIPLSAGLGGGSSDAAAVIKALDNMFKLDIPKKEIMEIAASIGSDVPFFINGGTQLAEGKGELLTELNPLFPMNILLVNPGFEVSTAWVYKNFDPASVKLRPNTDNLIKAVNNNNLNMLARNMENVLESVTIKRYEIIDNIKKQILQQGAKGSIMSGSGPTVFGIFTDSNTAVKAFDALKKDYFKCYLTRTVS